LTPTIEHQTNAGKQQSASERAAPFRLKRNTHDPIAMKAKSNARNPMVRSKWFCFIVTPIMRSATVSIMKNDAEVKRWGMNTVSGNTPIPMRQNELKSRRNAPVFRERILINPRENIKVRSPPIIMPLLKTPAVLA
jgi:hypothetical protein